MLRLAHIPLESRRRRDTIIMGGGIANPEALAEFVDVFLLGEFEAVADEFVAVLNRYKHKEDRLRGLAGVSGFYVPAFYEAQKEHTQFYLRPLNDYAPYPLEKVPVRDLDSAFYPARWLTPLAEIVHDRAQIEIARGCPHRCSFCQARCLYYPYRERRVSTIIKIAREIYATSGYENVSLLALSVSDHSGLQELIDELIDYFREKRVGVSLPSLRVDDILQWAPKKLRALKKIPLTLAVETAQDTLREKLNKRIDTKKLFEAAKIFRTLNMRHVKLYFMFGLPEERDEDLWAMGDFIRHIRDQSRLEIHVSVNAFIPKPLSSLEASFVVPEEELTRRREIILKSVGRLRGIKLSISSIPRTMLEAIIARGDRSLSRVILRAYELGARFDSYKEYFDWSIWRRAMSETGFDYQNLLRSEQEIFPWSGVVCKGSA